MKEEYKIEYFYSSKSTSGNSGIVASVGLTSNLFLQTIALSFSILLNHWGIRISLSRYEKHLGKTTFIDAEYSIHTSTHVSCSLVTVFFV